ncbi:hypothetical protein PUN28_004476 [Cardiocondyla obscurior]|uniref:Uncharacterized protein n=1 Tax=Cardiocondyla obscurior TaxID=286306 RepID=A0AAW2GAY2_9HYME
MYIIKVKLYHEIEVPFHPSGISLVERRFVFRNSFAIFRCFNNQCMFLLLFSVQQLGNLSSKVSESPNRMLRRVSVLEIIFNFIRKEIHKRIISKFPSQCFGMNSEGSLLKVVARINNEVKSLKKMSCSYIITKRQLSSY